MGISTGVNDPNGTTNQQYIGKIGKRMGRINVRLSAAGVCRETKKPDGIGLRCTLNWCGVDGGLTEL